MNDQNSHELHVNMVKSNESVFSDLELMKYKIKSVDAKKILRLLEDAIGKIEMIGLLLQLEKNTFDPELSDSVRSTLNSFAYIIRKISSNQCNHYDDNSLKADCDTFIKDSWMLKWVIPDSFKLTPPNNVAALSFLLRQLEFDIIEQFSKTPIEVKQESKTLKELKIYVSELSDEVKYLREQLEGTRQQKIKIEKDSEGIIEELRLDVGRIEWLATDKMDSNIKAAKKVIDKTEKDGQEEVTRLYQQVLKLYDNLDEVLKNNMQSEQELRQDMRLIKEEIAAVITQYDLEMGDRQSKYDYLHKEYEDELDKADKLNTQVDELKEAYDIIMEEMRRKAEEMENLQIELEKQGKAAVVIQAIWRGYRTRKFLKGGDKKEKGKKTGKKGKGKKGK